MAFGARARFLASVDPPDEPASVDHVSTLLSLLDLLRDPGAFKKQLQALSDATAAHKREADRSASERAAVEKSRDAFTADRARLDAELEQHRARMESERTLVESDRKAAARAAAAAEEDRRVAAGLVAEQRKRLAAVESAVRGA